jgi:protein-S-isoprenylcysteine O-methyltransferase Ste14
MISIDNAIDIFIPAMPGKLLALDNYPYLSAIVVIYLIGFAALHSLMASLKAKGMARRLLGSKVDPWYSVLFIAVAAITLLPLAAMMILMLIVDPGDVLYFVTLPWIWFFFLAQLIVGLGSLKAFLDAPHRFLIRAQLTGPHSSDAFPLGIKGIYCRIRDPFLLSGLLIIWLTPFMTVNLLLIYIITSAYLFLGSLHWESRLQAQFGEAYKAYQRKVPRMIPNRNKRWDSCLGKRDIEEGK